MNINKLTINYVKSVSEKKKFNLQSKALNVLFEKMKDQDISEQIDKGAEAFFESNKNLHITRDFYFKKDSFTPRNILLISPLYYIYYTNLVFNLFYNSHLIKNDELDFSKQDVTIFYSGVLKYIDDDDENFQNANFSKSFNKFQMLKQSISDKSVIKFDIKDFFNSISTKKLVEKLKSYFGLNNKYVLDLEYFFVNTQLNYLPQFHYSIASSILSQFYLKEFDSHFIQTISQKDAKLIRFVDDMFLYQDPAFTIKDFNTITDKMNSILWKEDLTLNLNKTRLFYGDEFKENNKLIDFEEYGLDYEPDYIVEEKIRQKAKEILDNNQFFSLLSELNSIYTLEGVNIDKYRMKLKDIADEDHSKIFNSIIHSSLWKRLSIKEMQWLLSNWNYIYFNPSQFTILFFKLEKFLSKKVVGVNDYTEKFTNTILNLNDPTFREIISINIYISQNSSTKYSYQQLSKVISKVDYGYFTYINLYVA